MQQIAIILNQPDAKDFINPVLKAESNMGFLLTSIVAYGFFKDKFILTFVRTNIVPDIKIN
jgi:hypothetical protein